MRSDAGTYQPTFPTKWQLRLMRVLRWFDWFPLVTRRRLKATDAYWSQLHDREMARMSDEVSRLRGELKKRWVSLADAERRAEEAKGHLVAIQEALER